MRSSAIIILFLFISACSGGGGGGASDSPPPPVPTTTVSGVAYDAAISGGTASIYAYSGGVKGTQLGQTTTRQDGSFDIPIQSESTPLLIEVTGGTYVEEASGTGVGLTAGQSLRAVLNHTTGASSTVYVTPFTHIAAGLAAFRIRQGISTSTAISSANQEISNILGFDVLATRPINITDPANATAFPSNGHVYGFLTAAISHLTAYISERSGTRVHSAQNSIAFAQQLYNDVSADGFLNGQGYDITGNIGPLSLGVFPLDQGIFRYAIAANVSAVANSTINRTSLTSAQLFSFANSYAMNVSVIWDNVTPISFNNGGLPEVSFTNLSSGSPIGRTAAINVSASDQVGMDHADLRVDNSLVSTIHGQGSPSFSLDTRTYENGAHTLNVTFVNNLGVPSSASLGINIDNTPPTSTGSYYYPGNCGPGRIDSGVASDALAGVSHVIGLYDNAVIPVDASGNWSAPIYPCVPYAPSSYYWRSYRIVDRAGNCSDYYFSQATGQFALSAQGTCN